MSGSTKTTSIGPGAPSGRVVNEIDIDELPRGRTSRLYLDLVHDALGHPVRLPVLVARGERAGPIFGITAGVHGNELNGIPVIHRLFEKLDPKAIKGSVVAAVVVNVPGFLRNQRSFKDSVDLNHIMPGSPNGNESQIYVNRLLDRVVRGLDYLVDLHTASFGRINSLYVRADMTSEMAAQLAYLQRPQIIVHNPPSDHTLRGAAMEMGIPAITVEIGDPQRFQSDFIRRSLAGLRAVLGEVGIVSKRPSDLGPEPVVCDRSEWLYTDRGGLLTVFPTVAERIDGGDVIARLTDPFGEVVKEYKAPHAGIVVGKSVNPVSPTGARILHLGHIADDVSDFQKRRPPRSRRSGTHGKE